jgi:phage-related minor tail protein
MNNANESKYAIQHRILRWLRVIAVAAIANGISFVAGYCLGESRQEKRLLNEFLVNAVNLGILDMERLRSLTEDADTNNTEIGSASANGQGGEP